MGWSGGAKVSCILRHQGVQLILAYSWARPAILVAGKGRWGIFLFFLFLHFHSCSFLPCPSLSSLLLSLLSLFSLSLGEDTKWPTRADVSLNPNTINQWPIWRKLTNTGRTRPTQKNSANATRIGQVFLYWHSLSFLLCGLDWRYRYYIQVVN